MSLTSRDLESLNEMFVKCLELSRDQIQEWARHKLEELCLAWWLRGVGAWRLGSQLEFLGEAPSHFPSRGDGEVAPEASSLLCNGERLTTPLMGGPYSIREGVDWTHSGLNQLL